MLRVNDRISIPDTELIERFIRSSGPGGQNVNKVSTAVQLTFDAGSSPSLSADVRHRLIAVAGSRASDSGVILITAQRHRTRERNRADARDRLRSLVLAAATPRKQRRPTRPKAGARERRLAGKRRRSGIKENRRRPDPAD